MFQHANLLLHESSLLSILGIDSAKPLFLVPIDDEAYARQKEGELDDGDSKDLQLKELVHFLFLFAS